MIKKVFEARQACFDFPLCGKNEMNKLLADNQYDSKQKPQKKTYCIAPNPLCFRLFILQKID